MQDKTSKTPVVDFHAHIFPDALATRAIETLAAGTDEAKPHTDGRLSGLLDSMDRAGIDHSVICSIATKPAQFDPILKWSVQIQSERITPLASVHPTDPELCNRPAQIKAAGIKGIKLHPYYQDFFLDDEKLYPFYQAVSDEGLLLVSHTGFDIAFPRVRRCDPVRISQLLRDFPRLLLITTHLGGWMDWDEVERHLIGHPVYMEISFAHTLDQIRMRDMLQRHPQEYLLFGTDSPWNDQAATLSHIRALGLEPAREAALLGGNAWRLLHPRQRNG